MTFIDKFDYLNKKFAKKADTKKLTDKFIAVQITLSDEDCGGTLYATFINGAFAFEPYDYHDNTVAIRISSALLEKILTNKADAEAEFKAGKIEAFGNLGHAIQMLNALKESAPAKKAKTPKTKKAEKKAEVKTEAPKKVEKKTEVKVEAPKKVEKKAEVKVEAPKKVEKKAEVKAEAPKKVEKKAEVKVEVPKKAEVKPEAAKAAEVVAPAKKNNKKNNAPKK